MDSKHVVLATIVAGLTFVVLYLIRCVKYGIKFDISSAASILGLSGGLLIGGASLIVSIFYPQIRNLPTFDYYTWFCGATATIFAINRLYNDTIKPPESSDD